MKAAALQVNWIFHLNRTRSKFPMGHKFVYLKLGTGQKRQEEEKSER